MNATFTSAVVPGVLSTMDVSLCVIMFIRVDLPTFMAPEQITLESAEMRCPLVEHTKYAYVSTHWCDFRVWN